MKNSLQYKLTPHELIPFNIWSNMYWTILDTTTKFQPERSMGSVDDTVVYLNVPLVVSRFGFCYNPLSECLYFETRSSLFRGWWLLSPSAEAKGPKYSSCVNDRILVKYSMTELLLLPMKLEECSLSTSLLTRPSMLFFLISNLDHDRLKTITTNVKINYTLFYAFGFVNLKLDYWIGVRAC